MAKVTISQTEPNILIVIKGSEAFVLSCLLKHYFANPHLLSVGRDKFLDKLKDLDQALWNLSPRLRENYSKD